MTIPETQSVVYTNKAKCHDCYRCVRVCPVNAIKMENGQAKVIPENCISCGTCIPECPQHAKTYIRQMDEVNDFLASQTPVLISIAPSFASVYNEWERKRLPSALREAGFDIVAETATGAYEVALKTREIIEGNPKKAHICSACPAIVNYIEKYCKDEIKYVTPVVSPMIAHAKMLRKEFGKNCKIVFAGPCVAKKDEARRPEYRQLIDAVLTFDELNEIFSRKNIDLKKCDASNFDNKVGGYSKLFALEAGLLKTAGIDQELTHNKVFALSGFEDVKDAIETIRETKEAFIIEPLFCRSGCINSPVLRQKNILHKKQEITDYHSEGILEMPVPKFQDILKANYQPKNRVYEKVFGEDQIQEVLRSNGKQEEADQLNCGACGYNTCKEKAIAVLNGIAEMEMCIPYMRRLAEQRNDKLIYADPNGIILLNKNLEIVSMNPAFQKMFNCSDKLVGKKLSYLIDPEPFEKLLTKKESRFNDIVKYYSYNLVCHQICYPIEEENQYVGIFVDITDTQHNKEKLRDLKTETAIQAQDLIDHQVKMAQELARFIGDYTAHGEMLMNKLINEIQK